MMIGEKNDEGKEKQNGRRKKEEEKDGREMIGE